VADVEVASREFITAKGVLTQFWARRVEVVRELAVRLLTLAMVSDWGNPKEFVRVQ
jgi:hypothetical protein